MMRPSILDLKKQKLPVEAPRAAEFSDVRVISGKIDGDEGEILSGGLIFRIRVRTWKPRSWKAEAPAVWEQLGRPSDRERKQWPSWDGIHDGDPVTEGHIAELERLGKC